MRNKNYIFKKRKYFVQEFSPEDRSNIIHNLFLNAFGEIDSYFTVVDVLSYLTRETDYIPWRTVYVHINEMVKILEHRKSFYPVSV